MTSTQHASPVEYHKGYRDGHTVALCIENQHVSVEWVCPHQGTTFPDLESAPMCRIAIDNSVDRVESLSLTCVPGEHFAWMGEEAFGEESYVKSTLDFPVTELPIHVEWWFGREDLYVLPYRPHPTAQAQTQVPTRRPDTGRLSTSVTATDRPLIVCLCGSTRFADAFAEATAVLTLAGQIVLSIGVDLRTASIPPDVDVEAVKARLDVLHRQKIAIADEVLVLNVGGYIGDSTRAEIAHAHTLGKKVRYLIGAPGAEPTAAQDEQ